MAKIIPSYNEETIRALAYQRWLDEGRPHGRAEIHWQWALASLAAMAERPTEGHAQLAGIPSLKPAAEDISLIDGIGPKIAKQLAQQGITTLSHLAAMSEKTLAALDTKLALKGRSKRDQWIAQAKELVSGKPPRAKVDQVKAARAK